MIQAWKVPHILKGVLTWVPVLNAWRLHNASTGGSNSFRYCYSVWLRHLVTLTPYGFQIKGAHVGELGPGDSIGVGLAALLSGADHYIGLDVVSFSAKADLEEILTGLAHMYARREPIPNEDEFPAVRPRLKSYEFPAYAINWRDFSDKLESVRDELRKGVNSGRFISYRAPWTSANEIAPASLDLVFSQAVLQYVDALEEVYEAMFMWLKPGGFSSHTIGFSASHLAPFWNGHWTYSDWQWRLARGKREFFLNRHPLSVHVACAKKVGFEVLRVVREHREAELDTDALSPRFRLIDADDLRTWGATLILRKQRSCATDVKDG